MWTLYERGKTCRDKETLVPVTASHPELCEASNVVITAEFIWSGCMLVAAAAVGVRTARAIDDLVQEPTVRVSRLVTLQLLLIGIGNLPSWALASAVTDSALRIDSAKGAAKFGAASLLPCAAGDG